MHASVLIIIVRISCVLSMESEILVQDGAMESPT